MVRGILKGTSKASAGFHHLLSLPFAPLRSSAFLIRRWQIARWSFWRAFLEKEENIHREAHFKFKRAPITPYSTNAGLRGSPTFLGRNTDNTVSSSSPPLLLRLLFLLRFTSRLNFPSPLEWPRRPVKIVGVIITEER